MLESERAFPKLWTYIFEWLHDENYFTLTKTHLWINNPAMEKYGLPNKELDLDYLLLFA